MKEQQPLFSVILIDDDSSEKVVIARIFKLLTDLPFRLDHVVKCSEAITLLAQRTYDLVLLDNRLSQRVSAQFSVPIIKEAIGSSPFAVISNDLSPTYLQDPLALGVDYVVDKAEIIGFLKSQMVHLLQSNGPIPPKDILIS